MFLLFALKINQILSLPVRLFLLVRLQLTWNVHSSTTTLLFSFWLLSLFCLHLSISVGRGFSPSECTPMCFPGSLVSKSILLTLSTSQRRLQAWNSLFLSTYLAYNRLHTYCFLLHNYCRIVIILACQNECFFHKGKSILLASPSIFLNDIKDVIDGFDGFIVQFLLTVALG